MAILAFFNMIFLKLLGCLMSVILMFSGMTYSDQAIEAKDPANVKLQFSVLSDVHLDNPDLQRYGIFAATLKNIGTAKAKQDALAFVGDNTEDAQILEYMTFYGLLSRYNTAKNTLVATGNHDMNPSKHEPAEAIGRHTFFLRSYNGRMTDKPYYSQEINGYTLIVLGDEKSQEGCSATISPAQLTWLADTLRSAPAGKPVFIFLHQVLAHVVSEFGGEDTVGAQSEEIRAMIEQYPNVFVFNGHLHSPQKIAQSGGVTYVNLPSLTKSDVPGVGFQVEAYEGKVILRARNYLAGEWLTEYDIPLA